MANGKAGRKRQETIVFFPEVYTNTQKMTDAQFGILMRAAFEYRFSGRDYSGDDLAVDIAFRTIAGQIDRYECIRETNRANAMNAEEGGDCKPNEAECSEIERNTPPSPSPSPNPSPEEKADKPPDLADRKTKEKKSDPFTVHAEGNRELLQALCDFEQMRKAMKKPLTPRAKELLIRKLEPFGIAQQIAMLNKSVEHCWQTVYPEEQAKPEPGGEFTPPAGMQLVEVEGGRREWRQIT